LSQVSSIFSQLLHLVPRPLFEEIVRRHRGERHARGLRCWDQFVAMLFCQLGQAQSLREIYEGLQASEGKLVHLGVTKAPKHSTLAYANQHRPWEIYQDLFLALLNHLRAKLPTHAKTPLLVSGKLYSLDSTVIDLCARVFDWAKYRTTKGAVKIHLLLDHDGLLPEYAVITEGKVADIKIARKFQFPEGAMLVFDRGYCDYDWFANLTARRIHFVTRLKDNASWVSLETRPVPADANVRKDEIVVFTQQATDDNQTFFRRVVWWDEAHQREFAFLTNHFDLDATTVAAVYRERWKIELLFKALKQNLKIKTFVGTSANALKIQIWTALIALLLVRYLQLSSRLQWHLSRFLALLRHQLFVYRDLWRFLDNPLEGPLPLRKDYIAPQPSLFAMIAAGPPESTQPDANGQPQMQNTNTESTSPLLSNQPQPVPG
jgi:hypothetical protein